MIVMPAMPPEQTASWLGLLDLYDHPNRLAFELNGIILATDANFVLCDDPAVLALARQIVRRRLGLLDNGNPARP